MTDTPASRDCVLLFRLIAALDIAAAAAAVTDLAVIETMLSHPHTWADLLSVSQLGPLACMVVTASLLLGSIALYFRSTGTLLVTSTVTLIATLLIGGELIASLLNPGPQHPAVWGQPSTFEFAFPEYEPFFGLGGRFRRYVNARIVRPGDSLGRRFVTNSFGFRGDHEPRSSGPSILILGDSFANGFGVDQDRFFGSLLERALNSGGMSYQTLSAETSDPPLSLHYLLKAHASFRPTCAVLGIFLGNDLQQTFLESELAAGRFRRDARGMPETNPEHSRVRVERRAKEFLTNHPYARIMDAPEYFTLSRLGDFMEKSESIPFLNNLLLVRAVQSYVAGGWLASAAESQPSPSFAAEAEHRLRRKQLLEHGLTLGLLLRKEPLMVRKWYRGLLHAFEGFARASAELDLPIVVVNFPLRAQVSRSDFLRLSRYWNLAESDFSWQKPARRLRALANRAGLPLSDPVRSMRERSRSESLYLPFDLHLNARGNEVLTNSSVEFIRSRCARRAGP